MVCKLWNWLGMGSNPKLRLELGDNGPGWKMYNIDYGSSGDIPSSEDAKRQWVSWNVKDENGNYYGTIDLNGSNGQQAAFGDYKEGQVYKLKGTTFSNYDKPNEYQLKCEAIFPIVGSAPPIISNLGWFNGQGNFDSDPTVGKNFWVQDYGIGMWSADSAIDAIGQSTAGPQFSSRAYPIHIDQGAPNWIVSGGVGVAFDGLWQIDIQIGSDGRSTNPFCETFYLAERANFVAGPVNYLDGSPDHPAPYGREIDIMETKWADGGPSMNLPNGGNTGWNPASIWEFLKGSPKWSDVGGAPTPRFITFGCLIREDNLWLYAYDGFNQWYCTEAVPKNSSYVQNYKFAPYIGTWATSGIQRGGGFWTRYKNFVYLTQNDVQIINKNPHDNPDAFGKVLIPRRG
jgi:hypothetical protein